MTDPQVFERNLNALLHAAVDGNVRIIEARHKATSEPCVLLCFVNRVKLPPLIIGGSERLAEQIVPVFEFIIGDPTALYTPVVEPPPADNVVQLRPATKQESSDGPSAA